MEIDINSIQNKCSDGGKDSPCQKTHAMLLVEGMVRSCKAVSSYETACTMLMEILPVVSSDAAALEALLRGKEEVRQFFEKRNTPQPSTQIEGCNVFMGETQGDRFVGKDMKVDVNSPGNQIVNQQYNKENNE